MNELFRKFPWKEYKPLFVMGGLVLLLIVAVAVMSHFWPRYEERFFELGLLGRYKKAEEYFPGNTSTVEVGFDVTWFVYLHNHMGSPQEVSVRVKLLNATMLAPDDRGHEPSPYPVLFEVPVSLDVDETLLVPFVWGVSEADVLNDSFVIKGLKIDDVFVAVDASALSVSRFRLVFELWVYDQSSGEYRFFWVSKGEHYSASLYMWFDVAMPSVELLQT